ncbi:MAG: DNA adenine methylase [Myxococcales bacterium]|jgi:DNA adenine methylase
MARPKKSESSLRPFLKWAGGKTQLLDELVARTPERFGTYHEPFLGGGALFFRLKLLGRVRRARLSDVNPELINAWKVVRDTPYDLVAALEKLEDRLAEKDYYEIRGLDPDKMLPAERAARLLYLNKTCFNGLYRENSKGKFNVPYGRYTRPKVLDRELLLNVSKALEEADIQAQPFLKVAKSAKPGDFVYFDPPYHPVSTTSSFTKYSRSGFGEQEQRVLAQVFADLAERGVHVLLSNSDTPLIHELYEGKGFEITRIEAARAINSKADKRGPVGELLVRATGQLAEKSADAVDSQLGIDFKHTVKVT